MFPGTATACSRLRPEPIPLCPRRRPGRVGAALDGALRRHVRVQLWHLLEWRRRRRGAACGCVAAFASGSVAVRRRSCVAANHAPPRARRQRRHLLQLVVLHQHGAVRCRAAPVRAGHAQRRRLCIQTSPLSNLIAIVLYYPLIPLCPLMPSIT